MSVSEDSRMTNTEIISFIVILCFLLFIIQSLKILFDKIHLVHRDIGELRNELARLTNR